MVAEVAGEPQAWKPEERSALHPGSAANIIRQFVSAKLNPDESDSEYFDLYYFILTPNYGIASKTILFCAGGPGQIVLDADPNETNAGFLSANDYNVVFFHLRGSGFSQIPPLNKYDKFLKTRYAISDIEQIRAKFLGSDVSGSPRKWDAIIAWSYGTVLAQQYAHKHPYNVDKLILIAPISRHMFGDYKNSNDIFETYTQNVQDVHRDSLLEIYNSTAKEFRDEFGDLSGGHKDAIIEELFGRTHGVVKRVEDGFGGIPFVIDNYRHLEKSGDLKNVKLDQYSRNFFRKLRELRMVGSFTTPKKMTTIQARQLEIGKVLRNEVLDRKKSEGERLEKYSQGSHRVYYAMGVLDGLSPTFLREWIGGGKHDIRGALRRSGGDRNVGTQLNKWLEKLGIDDQEAISPWDPADYPHNRPTLILKGQADPVTAGGQAEYFFEHGLEGPKTFIEFPGLGHEFYLSRLGEDDPVSVLSGTLRFDPTGIPVGEVRAFTATVTGRRLNGRLRIELTPPDTIGREIEILGYGITYSSKDSDNRRIIALVKNIGAEAARIDNSDWAINCQFFSGTVRFNASPIPAGATQIVYGTVIRGGRNSRRLYHLNPPRDLEDAFDVLGFHIDQLNVVHVWFRANRDVAEAKTRKWKVVRGGEEHVFRLTPPHPLKKEEVDEVFTEVSGVKVESDEELEIVMPEDSDEALEASVPQEEAETEIPIILWNTRSNESFDAAPANWLVENPYFSAIVHVDPPGIQAGSGTKVIGTIGEITWKKWIEIAKPKGMDPNLELIGINVLAEDKLCLLVKNVGTETVKAEASEWFWMDPLENGSRGGAMKSLRMRRRLLNRLIYAFLVMDPAIFKDEERNELFRGVREWFREDAQKLKII